MTRGDEPVPSGFRFTVRDVFVLTGRGTTVIGFVDAGDVTIGDRLRVARTGAVAECANLGGVYDRRWTPDQPPLLGLVLPALSRDDVAPRDVIVAVGSGA